MSRKKAGNSSRKGKMAPLGDATPNQGLATVAGGWKGSSQLAARLDAVLRTPPRRSRARVTASEGASPATRRRLKSSRAGLFALLALVCCAPETAGKYPVAGERADAVGGLILDGEAVAPKGPVSAVGMGQAP